MRGPYVLDYCVERRAQLGNVARLQNERDGFHPFIKVGISVEWSFARGVFAAGETPEVVDDSVRLEQLEHGGNAALDVHSPALLPESGAELHGANRDRMHHRVRRVIQVDNTLISPVVGGREAEREQ